MKPPKSAILSPFNPEKVAFGRHETFALRYGWLTKGFQALLASKDGRIFDSEDATVELGVGRNMVHAIRYWLQAARLIERKPKGGFNPTKLGKHLFSENGWDPYLEDEATIWLVHWLIASNAEMATAWYWFFNRFHKPEFTGEEISSSLLDFARQQISAKTAETTLKGDAALILRMYVQSKGNTNRPIEDALDSPLALLRLITRTQESRSYVSKPDTRDGLPLDIFGFAVAELFNTRADNMLPIESLMYSNEVYPAVGSVFRLTENALLRHLESLIREMPGNFEIRETAGIHQIYKLSDIDPITFLKNHYGRKPRKVAA
ncbi:MAG: DUF4007 family protein [Candidatus Poseidoniia archaeon]|jgi:hypothetical protein|nr:DUF4007 family protein [Candidatus Poseidoniia archaeon]|tara:strand:+ start:388 stop:1344 length:957 start_codon:yes stop_codon:yes gene_type:complete